MKIHILITHNYEQQVVEFDLCILVIHTVNNPFKFLHRSILVLWSLCKKYINTIISKFDVLIMVIYLFVDMERLLLSRLLLYSLDL